MSVSINGTNGLTFSDGSSQNTGATGFGFKNRILNGSMVLDQRNNGASFTVGNLGYGIDRWLTQAVTASGTGQRVTGSTGNNNALRITGATGNTTIQVSQRIEAANIYDCASQTVTVSFTLYGSASGSVSVRFLYPTATDNYTSVTEPVGGTTVNFTTTPTTYTVTRTLDANANKGVWVLLDFGAVGNAVTRTIEFFQLEKGSTATSFDYRPYGTELALCQRYYYKIKPGFQYGDLAPMGRAQTGSQTVNTLYFPVPMRAIPSSVETSGTATDYTIAYLATVTTCNAVPTITLSTALTTGYVNAYVASGLTSGNAVCLLANSSNGYLGWSAEL